MLRTVLFSVFCLFSDEAIIFIKITQRMMRVDIVPFLMNWFGWLVQVIQLIDWKLSIEERTTVKCILYANVLYNDNTESPA